VPGCCNVSLFKICACQKGIAANDKHVAGFYSVRTLSDLA